MILIISAIAVLFDMTTFMRLWPISKIMNLITIDSAMLWGQVGEKVSLKEQSLDKVWWGVIIAFAVSIGANLLTHFSVDRKSFPHLRMKSNK